MYTVLVVDDDSSVLNILERLGTTHGYTILPARSAEEAHAQVKRHTPDAIVMDLQLPSCYGIQLLRELRARGIDAFALILAARIDTVDMQHWEENRIFDFVLKPFKIDVIAKKIEAAASATRGEESLCEFLRGVICRNSTPAMVV